MIIYNPQKIATFLRIRGSVFPRAFLHAAPAAVLALFLKLQVDQDWSLFEFKPFNYLEESSVYSGFTFVLGFILVFRTSQSYSRYWTAATAVHTMRAEWVDACSTLMCFASTTKKSKKELEDFRHVVIRLFCLLHAMAMEELADLEDENFPLIDIEGFDSEDLKVLLDERAQSHKVELVMNWIKVYIMQMCEVGLITTPPPIMTRVFQELSLGLVHYEEALQIVIWPFPFPYAQMTVFTIAVYMLLTPLVIATWNAPAWMCALATLGSGMCMKSLDLIAAELDNPFGEDANDLPSFAMHQEMVETLLLLVNDAVWKVPRLLPTYCGDYEELLTRSDEEQTSLYQHWDKLQAMTPMSRGRRRASLSAYVGQSPRARQPATPKPTNFESAVNSASMMPEEGELEVTSVKSLEKSTAGFVPNSPTKVKGKWMKSYRKLKMARLLRIPVDEDDDGIGELNVSKGTSRMLDLRRVRRARQGRSPRPRPSHQSNTSDTSSVASLASRSPRPVSKEVGGLDASQASELNSPTAQALAAALTVDSEALWHTLSTSRGQGASEDAVPQHLSNSPKPPAALPPNMVPSSPSRGAYLKALPPDRPGPEKRECSGTLGRDTTIDSLGASLGASLGEAPPWREFLLEFSSQLGKHLQEQMREMDRSYEPYLRAAADAVYARHLQSLEKMSTNHQTILVANADIVPVASASATPTASCEAANGRLM